ncbi:hypothetical protein Hanom_Chr17g01559151 [Helianthus anomalus]
MLTLTFTNLSCSMPDILKRYEDHKHADEAVRRTVREELTLQYRNVRTADELTEMIQRHLNEHKVQQADVAELFQLEKQTEANLQQVRTIKVSLPFHKTDHTKLLY